MSGYRLVLVLLLAATAVSGWTVSKWGGPSEIAQDVSPSVTTAPAQAEPSVSDEEVRASLPPESEAATTSLGDIQGGQEDASGPETSPGLSEDPAADAADSPPEPESTQPQQWGVRDVQRALARLGYYEGSVDGMIGPLTRHALRTFQKDEGIKATGRIEPPVSDALERRVTEATRSGGG